MPFEPPLHDTCWVTLALHSNGDGWVTDAVVEVMQPCESVTVCVKVPANKPLCAPVPEYGPVPPVHDTCTTPLEPPLHDT
jgi:hypothetical protein